MSFPAFDKKGKITKAVFIIEKSEGKTRYRREPYNLVSYNNDSVAEPVTYMEGLPVQSLRPGQSGIEYYDEVLFLSSPDVTHSTSRIGYDDTDRPTVNYVPQ